ncbi:MAG: hypothetical protein EU529_13250 [Promethearchaeota archaeon]|nr:MAG: hypothetical protein EU529_13250 [Candidatus Lokiarchaeota archaeon]
MSQENKEKEQHELDKIRMKKMKELMEAQKRKQASQDIISNLWEKVDYVLKIVLMPEAYNHLINLKEKEPQIYQKIFNELVSPEVVQNVDYLLTIISRQGGVPRRIPLDAIVYLERQAKGIKSKIQVKRKDELMDLGQYLSK